MVPRDGAPLVNAPSKWFTASITNFWSSKLYILQNAAFDEEAKTFLDQTKINQEQIRYNVEVAGVSGLTQIELNQGMSKQQHQTMSKLGVNCELARPKLGLNQDKILTKN